jgi:hypothetical protein
MIPVWPAEIPRPQRSSWQLQYTDPRLQRKVDTGLPGHRRRWSNVARQVSMTVKLTRSEKASFETFFEDDLNHGVRPFFMPDPTTDGWQMLTSDGVPLLTDSGVPLLLSASWLCVFGEDMPSEAIEGTRFQISFSIWVMP